MVREIEYERKFADVVEAAGGLCLKLRIDGQDGFPDRTIITPQGVDFAEFKTPRGRLRPTQRKWQRVLRDMGYACPVCRDLDQAMKEFEEWL